MTFPTDAIYKFLAVIGFTIVSASTVMWLTDRSALQEDLVATARAAAAATETQAHLVGQMQAAKILVSEAETHLSKARELYATRKDSAGDRELRESETKSRMSRELHISIEPLLKDFSARSIELKQASAAAAARSDGHATLRWVLAIGFVVGLVVFLASCLAWQRATLQAKLDEA